jgi:hypothetical protein
LLEKISTMLNYEEQIKESFRRVAWTRKKEQAED